MSLNKNRITELGSNFTDCKKLGFRDEAALTKDHKSIDLKYLWKLNRMAARLLHDAIFEPSTKVYTVAQTKLNGIQRNSQVSKILRVAIDCVSKKLSVDGDWRHLSVDGDSALKRCHA